MSSACLLIANDVAPGLEADFEAWYQRQHLDERLAVPGFRTARRYRALGASHAYVAFYELESVESLSSAAYRTRLEAPTDWTRAVMPGFRRMTRTVMETEQDLGGGMGALMDLVVIEADAGAFPGDALVPRLSAHPAFERLRLLRASPSAASVATSQEASLRPGGDATFDRVALVEWADLATGDIPDARQWLADVGMPVKRAEGGRYRLVNARSAPRPG